MRTPGLFRLFSLFLVACLLLPVAGHVHASEDDSDEDGYTDDIDQCPAEGDWYGYGVDEYGCPIPPPDRDGDGVEDALDVCPDMGDIYGQGVDGNGCPYYLPDPDYDSDGDGFDDSYDSCPYDGDYGYGVDPNGCPNQDSDWDGYWDYDDACPYQGDEGYGVDGSGCPYGGGNYDSDWDGIEDAYDSCPYEGDAGYGVDEFGCPFTDWDGDGILDIYDSCPDQGDHWGYGVDAFGCPIDDSDGDGFLDPDDSCPYEEDEYGYGIDDTGCPLLEPPDTDGDGWPDDNDNCLNQVNVDQLDTDDDRIGDACDTYTVLMQKNGAAPASSFGSGIAFGDINLDGVQDLVVLAPNATVDDAGTELRKAGEIHVVSGADGSVIRTIAGWQEHQRFAAVAVAPDQNSDGVPDILVGEPFASVTHPTRGVLKRAGRVSLLSGADGAVLATVAEGSRIQGRFGSSLAVGDVNGDGHADLVVGAPYAQVAGQARAGEVTVFDGISNSELYRRGGDQAEAFFGAAVAVNEGYLFVGEPGRDTAAGADSGQAQVFNAANASGAALRVLEGSQAGHQLGRSLAAHAGRWAVSAGAPSLQEGLDEVLVFEGLAVEPVVTLQRGVGMLFGTALAMGDLNNDTVADVAVGMPRYSVSASLRGAGTLEVLDGSRW